jgi:hypothetical protein
MALTNCGCANTISKEPAVADGIKKMRQSL